jgi:uncharacterized protein (TIGR00661 family)
MRILYGVVGEGMGHATRSRAVIEHLLAGGHELRVVVSGRAHAFMKDRLEGRERLTLHEIEGFHLEFDRAGIDLLETVLGNIELAPRRLRKNLEVYADVAEEDFEPELVISDFESWAYLYARNHLIPVISIDNMQIINRCEHDDALTADDSFDFQLAKLAVRLKVPGAYHYLITSFFYPEVGKRRTTLIPPILRPEILAAKREPGEHVLVYKTRSDDEGLVEMLQGLPWSFRVYGLGDGGVQGNVELKGFSETGFVDDLRTAKAVVANAGFSLMSEAVHLHVPMLAIPIPGQYEQELNARYLAQLGYGSWTPELDEDVIRRFLDRCEAHTLALEGYASVDNNMTLSCVDELIDCVAAGISRPKRLQSPSRGTYPRGG